MNLPKIQAIAAPLSAPIPSALGVALQAYLYFEGQSLALAWVAALGAFVGIEAIGGASCYAVVKLHRQRDYGIEFWIAFCGIVAYIGSGLYTLAGSPLIIFFFLAPFSYFAYSILKSMEIEIGQKVTETEAQIALINAETRRVNAETRKAKAGEAKAAPERTQNEQGEQNKQNEQNGLRLKIFAILEQNGEVGPREMARRAGCAPSTAKTHIDRWKAKH